MALKLVFERIDVPLFEAFGAEPAAKQADGAILERKAALVASWRSPASIVPKPDPDD